MERKTDTIKGHFDLTVIGAGLAGISASLFAAKKGIKTAIIGDNNSIRFASGLLDILGVYPRGSGEQLDSPWEALETLKKEMPKHPYGRVSRDNIEKSLDGIIDFLKEAGLPYVRNREKNYRVVTAAGTVKHTACIPASMETGVKAYEEKWPVLIVDFYGLREFSAHQIALMLSDRWKNIKTVRLHFPGTFDLQETYLGHIASSLEREKIQNRIAEEVKKHIDGVKAVGFPAILGIEGVEKVTAALSEKIGLPVFEIPTMPTSIPGMRIARAFELRCSSMDITRILAGKVQDVREMGKDGFTIEYGDSSLSGSFTTKGIILATGRFMGGGLVAGRERISEKLFDLPVAQPAGREEWHCEDFFDSKGHGINRAGITVDDTFRPVTRDGGPDSEHLYAAGSIISENDWMRLKSGAGTAVSTAYCAVESFARCFESKDS